MRSIIAILLMLIVSFSLVINSAQAKRFGGGRSIGMQRSVSSFSRPQPLQSQRAGMSSPNRWLSPLMGLAAGGLLAYLFMGHGLGSGIFSWLLIAGVLYFVFNFIRSKMQLAPQNAFQQSSWQPSNQANTAAGFSGYQNASNNSQYPVGFEPDNFLRAAKVLFIRLQAAYDQKNLADLREFTTPEMYAEIQLQLQERGNALNQTDVQSLDAELLNATVEYQVMLASVRFTGLIREDQHPAATAINEIWHYRKDESRSTWLVAGIQQ